MVQSNYVTRNTIKSKFVYNSRVIAFDGAGSWSFGNDFARIVVIFNVDNSSDNHFNTDNQKNNLLAFGKGPQPMILMSKNLVFTNANKNCSLSLYYNSHKSYLHMNKTKIPKFKTWHTLV